MKLHDGESFVENDGSFVLHKQKVLIVVFARLTCSTFDRHELETTT